MAGIILRFIGKYFLIILGLGSVLVLIFPELGIYPMITFIGIPLAFAYWAFPALFIISALTALYYAVIPGRGMLYLALCLGAGLLTLSVPAYFFDKPTQLRVQALVDGDHDNLTLPIQVKSIGVRKKTRYRLGKDVTKCDAFCLHALLSGTADKIFVSLIKDPKSKISTDEAAIEYSIQKLDQCPAVKFTTKHHGLGLMADPSGNTRSADEIEVMKLRISDGDCLVSRRATLREADMIISNYRVVTGTYFTKIGFSLGSNVVNADRISVHTLSKDDLTLNEIYRHTEVTYRPLAFMLLPAPVFGSNFDVKMGWLRNKQKINIANNNSEGPDWSGFLTNTLEFKLALEGEGTKSMVLSKISNVLGEQRSPTVAEWQIFSAYFDRLGVGRNNKIEKDDFDIALRMLDSSFFPAPPRLYNISKYAARLKDTNLTTDLASRLLAKIDEKNSWSDILSITRKTTMSNLGLALNFLPDYAFKPHFDKLVALSKNADIQRYSNRMLKKIGIFGSRGVQTLTKLIDTGLEGGSHFYRNHHQLPYLAGIEGLCIAGEEAAPGLPHMLALLKNDRLALHGSYGKLTTKTLVRMGADPEDIWSYYSSANKNKSRKNFNWEVERARSDTPRCIY